MKQKTIDLLIVGVLLAVAACVAHCETNKPPVVNPPTWASVPGTIDARLFTNDVTKFVGVRYADDGKVEEQTTLYIRKVYLVPMQVIKWWNPLTNGWETFEAPLITPRLVSETLGTNVVTK